VPPLMVWQYLTASRMASEPAISLIGFIVGRSPLSSTISSIDNAIAWASRRAWVIGLS